MRLAVPVQARQRFRLRDGRPAQQSRRWPSGTRVRFRPMPNDRIRIAVDREHRRPHQAAQAQSQDPASHRRASSIPTRRGTARAGDACRRTVDGSGIDSRCSSISRTSSRSWRDRFSKCQTRRSQVIMVDLENRGDGIRHPLIIVLFGLELLQALRGDPIAPHLPAGVRRGPLGLQPSVGQRLLQCRIQRALFHAQLVARQARESAARSRSRAAVPGRTTRRINRISVPGGRPAT